VPRPALHWAEIKAIARCPRKTTHTVSVSLMMIPPKCFLSRFLSPTRDEPTHPRAHMQPLMHSPPLLWDGSSVEVALSNCTERIRDTFFNFTGRVKCGAWGASALIRYFSTRSRTRVCARDSPNKRVGCLPLRLPTQMRNQKTLLHRAGRKVLHPL